MSNPATTFRRVVPPQASSFMQLVELHTAHPEALSPLLERWRSDSAQASTRPVSVMHDRDDSGHFVLLMQYPSYAASFSAEPASEYAAELALLLDDRPRFVSLDPS